LLLRMFAPPNIEQLHWGYSTQHAGTTRLGEPSAHIAPRPHHALVCISRDPMAWLKERAGGFRTREARVGSMFRRWWQVGQMPAFLPQERSFLRIGKDRHELTQVHFSGFLHVFLRSNSRLYHDSGKGPRQLLLDSQRHRMPGESCPVLGLFGLPSAANLL
jgi:hypothetical protein